MKKFINLSINGDFRLWAITIKNNAEEVKARYKNLGWKSIEHACYAEVARQFEGASLEEETKNSIAKAMRLLIIEKNSEFYGPSEALRECMPKLGQIIN